MPRILNLRPTIIYWLFDIRPETLIEHPDGRPFYCGKTVRDVPYRLRKHRTYAFRQPTRPISVWLNRCGEHVRVQIVETVPADGKWDERERFWISTIRLFYPGGANVSDGGTGVPGHVHSAETRAKMSIAMMGIKRSPESRARMSESQKRKAPPSAETRAKLSVASKGRKLTTEHRAKMSASNTGKKRSIETCARISASKKGQKWSVEARAAHQRG